MRRLLLGVVLLALVAGCTTPAAPGATPQKPTFNDTDVMFLQMMIAHHGPAEQMLALVETRARRPEVKTFAAAVRVTQADETRTMTEWLRSWGEPLVSTAGQDAHAAHGGALPKGEMQIAALTQASDAEFDRVFLNLFSGYQQTAVTLAQMEIAGGAHGPSVELAGRVEKNRRAQIDLMLRYAG
jgi:uncharacterized protein (DUF305 family)